jgi:hypothetical protein
LLHPSKAQIYERHLQPEGRECLAEELFFYTDATAIQDERLGFSQNSEVVTVTHPRH